MKRLSVLWFCLVVFVSLAACTPTEKAARTDGWNAAHLKCYSGGVLIYEGDSKDEVKWSDAGAWSFVDAKTDQYVRMSADCIVTTPHGN